MLCICSFSFNLISISKLTQNPSCCYFFSPHYCFLQDLQHWKIIGLGRRQRGLYTLRCTGSVTLLYFVSEDLSKFSSFLCNKSVNTCNLDSSNNDVTSNNVVRLWHYRLGYPSSQRLALLNTIVPKLNYCNNIRVF